MMADKLDELRDCIDRSCRVVQALDFARSGGSDDISRYEWTKAKDDLITARARERELMAEQEQPAKVAPVAYPVDVTDPDPLRQLVNDLRNLGRYAQADLLCCLLNTRDREHSRSEPAKRSYGKCEPWTHPLDNQPAHDQTPYFGGADVKRIQARGAELVAALQEACSRSPGGGLPDSLAVARWNALLGCIEAEGLFKR